MLYMLLGVKRVKQRRHLYFLLNSYIYFRFVDILYRLRTESCRSWCGFDVTVHATCFQHYCRHWRHRRYFSWKVQPKQCTTTTNISPVTPFYLYIGERWQYSTTQVYWMWLYRTFKWCTSVCNNAQYRKWPTNPRRLCFTWWHNISKQTPECNSILLGQAAAKLVRSTEVKILYSSIVAVVNIQTQK